MNDSLICKRNILLVDDDRLVLVTIAKGLLDAGYSVNKAESVDDAVAMLANGERPDLVILDVSMPHKNGFELAERLRSFDQIPFIFLSANSDREVIELASDCGALSYLVKPVDNLQLLTGIEAALIRASELRNSNTTGIQFQELLDNERRISIAIGITMLENKLNRQSAFELLLKTAHSQHITLAELAKDVIIASETLSFLD